MRPVTNWNTWNRKDKSLRRRLLALRVKMNACLKISRRLIARLKISCVNTPRPLELRKREQLRHQVNKQRLPQKKLSKKIWMSLKFWLMNLCWMVLVSRVGKMNRRSSRSKMKRWNKMTMWLSLRLPTKQMSSSTIYLQRF